MEHRQNHHPKSERCMDRAPNGQERDQPWGRLCSDRGGFKHRSPEPAQVLIQPVSIFPWSEQWGLGLKFNVPLWKGSFWPRCWLFSFGSSKKTLRKDRGLHTADSCGHWWCPHHSVLSCAGRTNVQWDIAATSRTFCPNLGLNIVASPRNILRHQIYQYWCCFLKLCLFAPKPISSPFISFLMFFLVFRNNFPASQTDMSWSLYKNTRDMSHGFSRRNPRHLLHIPQDRGRVSFRALTICGWTTEHILGRHAPYCTLQEAGKLPSLTVVLHF